MLRSNARKAPYLLAGFLLLLCCGFFAFAVFTRTGSSGGVGGLNLNIPGAAVSSQNGGWDAGNQRIYTLKGQKTTVQVDFQNPYVYVFSLPKPWVTLSDVQTQAKDWQTSQSRLLSGSILTTQSGAFNSSDNKGYYDVVVNKTRSGRTAEQRNLFFARGGKSYRLSLTFGRSDSEADGDMVEGVWKTALRQLGIANNVIPSQP